ncbi:MAG: hypothetical protein JW999_03680 [Methanotrichaceae archaeon]|nr:hypothetical protein [Methanotrichaceae archaeon]
MDVSFSAWRHSREASLQLKGDSFSFLFDRRYTNRLNRMSRVFFEAYVVATKELAAQEDRFPSLSEIDAKMESGAVYAFKDRLMKNTEFFEEVKISGVSYLVPRALKFVDVTGTYTDLILNFDEGTVVLPTRRKTPSLPGNQMQPAEEEELMTPQAEEIENKKPTIAEDTQRQEAEAKPPSYPLQTPEAFEEISPATETAAAAAPIKPEEKVVVAASPPARETNKPPLPNKEIATPLKAVALLGAAILLVIAAAIFLPGPTPEPVPVLVEYSALVGYSVYLSNSSNDSYLGLNITNPQGMANDMEMALPRDIDQSISARGGIVTISHGENTLVRMNSSSDASVKIYLQGNWTTIPIGLSFYSPEGYDTSLQVHGKDYFVTRKNETSVLMFNLTGEEVSFEQSYTQKK